MHRIWRGVVVVAVTLTAACGESDSASSRASTSVLDASTDTVPLGDESATAATAGGYVRLASSPFSTLSTPTLPIVEPLPNGTY